MNKAKFYCVVTLALTTLLSACAAEPAPATLVVTAAAPTPTATSQPTVTMPTKTPVPAPTQTPLPSAMPYIQFLTGSAENIKISESSYPLDFEEDISRLPAGKYVIYTVARGEDQEVWIISLQENYHKKLLVCKNCPIEMNILESYTTETGWELVVSSEYWGASWLNRTLDVFVITVNKPRARWLHCEATYPSDGCLFQASPQGNWLVFTPYKRNDLEGSRHPAVVVSRDGSQVVLKGDDVFPGFWAPDNSGYAVSGKPDINGCGQYQLHFVSLENRSVSDWTDMLCQFERKNAWFAGWSPDGSRLAFLWLQKGGEPFLGKAEISSWRRISTIAGGEDPGLSVAAAAVCPAEVVSTGKIQECETMNRNLSGWVPDGGGSEIQWIANNNFLWWIEKRTEKSMLTYFWVINSSGEILGEQVVDGFRMIGFTEAKDWLLLMDQGGAIGAIRLDRPDLPIIYIANSAAWHDPYWLEIP